VTSRILNGVTTTWSHDQEGRLTTLGDPIGNFTYAYVGNSGRVQSLTYPNNQTTSYAYFPLAQDLRLQEIHHKKPDTTTLNKFNYIYDAVGNILTWTQQTDQDQAKAYDFGYDRADQLTLATFRTTDPTPVILKRYRYAYDPAGNRTAEQIDDDVTGASYDNMNRLTSRQAGGALLFGGTVNEPATVTVGGQPGTVTGQNAFSRSATVPSGASQVVVQATDPSGNVRTNTYGVNQAGTSTSFTYDANGNTTADGTKTYEWDAENRLVTVKQGGNTLASIGYDGQGRRAAKILGGLTTTYVSEGPQVLEEQPIAGAQTRYIYGAGIDRPLAQIVGGATFFTIADHLGSIVRAVDSVGSPVLTREYDPWGNPLQGAVADGYAFTGREWESATALYYYRARFYAPGMGRFLSEDPLGMQAAFNPSVYAKNRPIELIDPFGLAATPNCDDVCANAASSSMNTGQGGTVVCCKGIKCPCSFGVAPARRGECPDIDQIIVDHETKHMDESHCPSQKMCAPAHVKPPVSTAAVECTHRRESLTQLFKLRAQGNVCSQSAATATAGLIAYLKTCR
jgi:RHS repeat-associated protein